MTVTLWPDPTPLLNTDTEKAVDLLSCQNTISSDNSFLSTICHMLQRKYEGVCEGRVFLSAHCVAQKLSSVPDLIP